VRQFRRPILLGTAAALTLYFIVDSAFAHRRAAYARQISQLAVIHRTILPPASLVLDFAISCACGVKGLITTKSVSSITCLQ
jgi:hypothetical protein